MSEDGLGEDISDGFWSIIERAGQDRLKLRDILWDLSEEEVARFHKEFVLATSVLRGEPFDALLYEAGESEDGVMDVAYWVVAQGRALYDAVLKNPDSIPRHVHVGDPALMHHIPGRVFYERFGKELDFY
ncbi:DUF4240 domain-containing protein [Corallococcus sicarius]|uniref:DUF4240 domain-containing protein n=1 Tax=Corallococcus sicarius TaxID=2316726 RepID=A0A3A8NYM0_9BACT|nr:DUF4240 domain-containing protein [Corallococcus sicarius]RKH44584.1 DUF4240 domain-containing protein [Corallococcus sicarius]